MCFHKLKNQPVPVIDNFGRTISSLRISITDRCNFRCAYCLPEEEVEWIPHDDILTYEELNRLVGIFSGLGITKIKITGGEPTMRRDLNVFIKHISQNPQIGDVSLTTNGYFLDKLAPLLQDAGLKRITVSLDSLKEERFNSIVGRKIFSKVYSNLLMLKEMSFNPVKVNVVVIRGFNDDEIVDFIRFANDTGYAVRFIEFMPLDHGKIWTHDKVVPLNEIRERIARDFDIVQISGNNEKSPAERYRISGGDAEVGFIASVSDPFCRNCGRIRLTSEGQLRTCLFAHNETDLRILIRGGADDDELRGIIHNALMNKEEGHMIGNKDFRKPRRPMHQIGG